MVGCSEALFTFLKSRGMSPDRLEAFGVAGEAPLEPWFGVSGASGVLRGLPKAPAGAAKNARGRVFRKKFRGFGSPGALTQPR